MIRALVVALALVACEGAEPDDGDGDGDRRGVLPLSRNTNYDPASPVKSADLNDLQDSTIAKSHGLLSKWISAITGRPGVAGVWAENPVYFEASAIGLLITIPLDLIPGDRLKTVAVTHYSGGVGSKEFEIYVGTDAGTNNLLPGWEVTIDPAEGAILIQAIGGADYTLQAGEYLTLRAINSAVGDRIYGARVGWDRPLP